MNHGSGNDYDRNPADLDEKKTISDDDESDDESDKQNPDHTSSNKENLDGSESGSGGGSGKGSDSDSESLVGEEPDKTAVTKSPLVLGSHLNPRNINTGSSTSDSKDESSVGGRSKIGSEDEDDDSDIGDSTTGPKSRSSTTGPNVGSSTTGSKAGSSTTGPKAGSSTTGSSGSSSSSSDRSDSSAPSSDSSGSSASSSDSSSVVLPGHPPQPVPRANPNPVGPAREAAINAIFFPQGGGGAGAPGGAPGAAPGGAPGAAPGAAPGGAPGGAPPPAPAAAQKVDVAQEEAGFSSDPWDKKFEHGHNAVGWGSDVLDHSANVVGGTANVLSAVYNDNDSAKEGIGLGSGIMNSGLGLMKAGFGIEGMIYHGRKARKAGDRNKIKRRQGMAGAFASGFKTLGGLATAASGALGINGVLNPDKSNRAGSKTAGAWTSLFGSVMGFGGALTNLVSSSMDADAFGKIKKLNDGKAISTDPSAANHKTNNRIFRANEMAASAAKNKYRRSVWNSIDSSLNTVGSLFSIAGSALKVGGNKSPLGAVFGAVANGISEITKVTSHIHNVRQKKHKAEDRKEYVEKYLNRKKDEIITKAGTSVNPPPVTDLSDDEAKRIVMKQLGCYNGNIVNNNPVQLPESMIKTIYNNRAVKRAKRLHDLPVNDKHPTLETLGLRDDATVQEIAEMLGYEK